MAGNFTAPWQVIISVVIKHLQLLMMDLGIMPLMEIIRHKTFAVVGIGDIENFAYDYCEARISRLLFLIYFG